MSFTFRQLLPGLVGSALLAACGSGGTEDGTLPLIAFPTDSITFSALGPDDQTPAVQIFTGTFSVNTVYMAALAEGTAIERVTYTLSGRTATISVYPKAPAALGPGRHTARISIFGQVCADASCSRLASGPAHYFSVSYAIPQVIRGVAPYVAQEQSTGSVIIRGLGFQKFTVTGVSFGGFPASQFSVTSDTQIEATHPGLSAGRYGVQIQAEGAPVPARSDAELVVVTPPAVVAGVAPYPTAGLTVTRLLYDPERNALLAATNQNGGELLRFQYAGDTWSAAEVLPIDTLRDIALSSDGRTLLALTDSGVTPVEADTLAAGVAFNASLDDGTTFTGIAVTNDGDAILTTTAGNNAASPLYLFEPRTGAFTSLPSLVNAAPVVSGDGALVVLVQQDSTDATSPAVYQLSASDQSIATTGLTINRNVIAPAMDRFASRLALNGAAAYDSSYNLIGALPDTTLAVAFSPDGTRLYAYDSVAAAIVTYDTTTTVGSGSSLNLVDVPLAIAADPGGNPHMVTSFTGDALFLGGSDKIVVVPAMQQ